MSKIKLLIFLFICLNLNGILNAQTWMRFTGTSSEPKGPEVEVISKDTNRTSIHTHVFGVIKKDTTVEGTVYQKITIPEQFKETDTLKAGKPQIPYVRYLVAVPDSAVISLSVQGLQPLMFYNTNLYPIPRWQLETDSSGLQWFSEVFTKDNTFYGKDTLYPEILAKIVSVMHLRDQRVVEIYLYPIQFNPHYQTITCYYDLNVTLTYSGKKVLNPKGLGPLESVGRDVIINYPLVETLPRPAQPPPQVRYITDLRNIDNKADYIMICGDVFLDNKTSADWIYELAQWRCLHNLMDIGIVRVSDILSQLNLASV